MQTVSKKCDNSPDTRSAIAPIPPKKANCMYKHTVACFRRLLIDYTHDARCTHAVPSTVALSSVFPRQ